MQHIQASIGIAALFLVAYCSNLGAEDRLGADLAAGKRAYRDGHYREAEQLYRKALALLTQVLAPESPEIADCKNTLASVYAAEGRYREAEDLFRQALEAWEKTPGRELSVAATLTNLGVALRLQAKYPEAESVQKRSLDLLENLAGSDELRTATSLNNLGELYNAEGRPEEAETYLRRAVAIREKILGGNDADTAL